LISPLPCGHAGKFTGTSHNHWTDGLIFAKIVNVNPAVWHIITWKDYIEGPFDTYESALAVAMELGRENRTKPQLKRLSRDFYQYRAPYDKQEKWWPTFWICTEAAARNRGIPIDRFIAQYDEAA
jgi:hypothetical protein